MKKLLFSIAIYLSFGIRAYAESENLTVETAEDAYEITMDEFELIARIVMAEAEGESFEAKHAVACVVLNRKESEYFPDTISEVIYQVKPIQFTCVWNGRYDRVLPDDSCYEAVTSAIYEDRIPVDVLFFTSNGYLKGYKKWSKIDDMYFSRKE